MDIHVIGDVAVDHFIFIDQDEATLHCRLNTDNCELSLRYGQKIPVKEIVQSLGGNAANVTVGLSRCGLKVGLYTEIGEDEPGRLVKEILNKEQISLEGVQINTNRSTNQSHILVYQGERTIFSYHDAHQSLPKKVEKVKAVYLTSLGEGWMKMYEAFINAQFIIYQPGTRQIREGILASKELLHQTDLLILNDREAEILLDRTFSSDKSLLHALLDTGAREVVVTKGKEGAIAGSDFEFWRAGIWREAVKRESTGSGDAFSSAYVASRLKDVPIPEALIRASVNAGSVMQQVGAEAGLMSWAEMETKSKTVGVKISKIE